MTIVRGLVLFLFCLFSQAHASEPVIQWLMSDLAPFRVLSGPAQGQGSSDLMEKMLMAQLPQYQHRSRFVSFERREVLHGDASALYCSFGILSTPKRQQQMYVSLPASVVMPLTLVTAEGSQLDQELLVQQKPNVDLQQLIKRQLHFGLLESGRAYSPLIELARTIPGGLLGTQSSTDQNPVDLLVAGRVDYLLEYPHRISFLLNYSKHPTAKLRFYLLAGDQNYQTTHVACSKHPDAPKLIAKINQQLLSLWRNPTYQETMLSWHDDKSKSSLQQYMQQVQSQLYNPSAAAVSD